MKVLAKEVEAMQKRHTEEVAELKEALKELNEELRKIQWKIAAATGGGVAVVSLIDHLAKVVK